MTEQVRKINFISAETFDEREFDPSEINFVDITDSIYDAANVQEKITPDYPLRYRYSTNPNINRATYDTNIGIETDSVNYINAGTANHIFYGNGGTVHEDGSSDTTTSYVDIPFNIDEDIILCAQSSATNSPASNGSTNNDTSVSYTYGILLGHYNSEGRFVPVYMMGSQYSFGSSTSGYGTVGRTLITGVSKTYKDSYEGTNYSNYTYATLYPTVGAPTTSHAFQFVKVNGEYELHSLSMRTVTSNQYSCKRKHPLSNEEKEALANISVIRFMPSYAAGFSNTRAFSVRKAGDITDIYNLTDFSAPYNLEIVTPVTYSRTLHLLGEDMLDYSLAYNKPSIEGRVLNGNIELGELGFQIQTKVETPLQQHEVNFDGVVGVVVETSGQFESSYYYSSDYTGIPGCYNIKDGITYTNKLFPYCGIAIPYSVGETITIPHILDKLVFGKLNDDGSITPAVSWNRGTNEATNGWNPIHQLDLAGVSSPANNRFLGLYYPTSGVNRSSIQYNEFSPETPECSFQLTDEGSETVRCIMLRHYTYGDLMGSGYQCTYEGDVCCPVSEIDVVFYIPAYQTSERYTVENLRKADIGGTLGVTFGSKEVFEATNAIDLDTNNFGNEIRLAWDDETMEVKNGELATKIATAADTLGLMKADSDDFDVDIDGTLSIKAGVTRNDVQPFTPQFPLSFEQTSNTNINAATYTDDGTTVTVTTTSTNYLSPRNNGSDGNVYMSDGGSVDSEGSMLITTSYVDIPFDMSKDAIVCSSGNNACSPLYNNSSAVSAIDNYGVFFGYKNLAGNFVPVYAVNNQWQFNSGSSPYISRRLFTGVATDYTNEWTSKYYSNQTRNTYVSTVAPQYQKHYFQFVQNNGNWELHAVSATTGMGTTSYRMICTLTADEQSALSQVTTVRFTPTRNSGTNTNIPFGVRRMGNIDINTISDNTAFDNYDLILPETTSQTLILKEDMDYDNLRNMPTINGVQVRGDMDLSQFNFQTATSASAPLRENSISTSNTVGITVPASGNMTASYYYNSTNTYIPLCTTTDENNIDYTDRVFPYCGVIIPYTLGQVICTPLGDDCMIFGHLNSDGSVKPLCHKVSTSATGYNFPAQLLSQSTKASSNGVDVYYGNGDAGNAGMTYHEPGEYGACHQLVQKDANTLQIRYLVDGSGKYRDIAVERLCGFNEVDVAIWVPCSTTNTLYNLDNLMCVNMTGNLGADFGIMSARAQQNQLSSLGITAYGNNLSLQYDDTTLKVTNGVLNVPVANNVNKLGLMKASSTDFVVQADGTLELAAGVTRTEVQPFTPQYPLVFEYSDNTNINAAVYTNDSFIVTGVNRLNATSNSSVPGGYYYTFYSGGYIYSDMSISLPSTTSYVDFPFDITQDVIYTVPENWGGSAANYSYTNTYDFSLYYGGIMLGYKNEVGNFVMTYLINNHERREASGSNYYVRMSRLTPTGFWSSAANSITGTRRTNQSTSTYYTTTAGGWPFQYYQFVDNNGDLELHCTCAQRYLDIPSDRAVATLTDLEKEAISKVTTVRLMPMHYTTNSTGASFGVRRMTGVDIHSISDNTLFTTYPRIMPQSTSQELMLKVADTIPTSVGVEYYA